MMKDSMETRKESVRLRRKEALDMGQVLSQCIRSLGLGAALTERRVLKAWEACSGAAHCTLRQSFRGGKLYVSLGSSVVRSHLTLQRQSLPGKMNAWLREQFPDLAESGEIVREVVLR